MLQLQSIAGNAAVGALLAGRKTRRVVQRLASGGSIPPPPVAPSAPAPEQHTGFRAAQARITAARRGVTKHPPAAKKAAEAGRAAKAPADGKEAQAKAAKAGEMAAAPAGGFDKAAFIAAVNAAMAKNAPKNLDEADDLAGSGKTDAVAAEVKGKVSQAKDGSAKPLTEASAKPPDTSKAADKPVTPLPPPPAAGSVPAVDGKAAMPARAPAEQTNLENGPAETGQQMAEADVTEDQLARSNEPELTGALAAKKEGEQHSATAPKEFREKESATLATAQQGAQASGGAGTAAMLAVRTSSMGKVTSAQQKTQTRDESRRAEVSGKIKGIFDATKTAVDLILAGIDPLVNTQFTEGERQAKAAFTAHHKARMDKYKDDRYSGLLGKGRWIRDKFADLPGEVNQFYVEAKQIYETRMKGVISDVADTVGREITRAKDRIAQGRKEITVYVDGLEPALKGMGKEAANEIGGQFDALDEAVNEKSQSLAEDLAEKYTAARTAVDEEIKALQEENKGLWSKAKDAIGGAIQTIVKLKDMLLGVLARAAGAVSKIIKDPIGFLGNFVGAVKAGVMNFGAHILDHLKKGLQSWLFGTLAEAGVEIPEKFDLKGIVTLILSMLGLTWASIRARLAKALPDWVLTALEGAVEVVKILTTEGVGGLWKFIVQKLTDLQEQVMGQIKDFVITKIITAGITWLISLLNPAAAFIKACKMIYDAVMWFVDNAQRMKEFVDSVLDSVESIANGGVGAVAGMIEATLGRAIPMVISGLASLLGLGGIAEKIQKILQTIQKPVGKVVDSIIGGVLKVGKKLLKKLKRKKKGKDGVGAEGGGKVAPASKAFGMHGAGHTVSIVPGPPFQLNMASGSPGKTVGRIQSAIERLQSKKPVPQPQLKALHKLLAFAQLIEQTGAKAEGGDARAAKRLEGHLTKLAEKLAAYGAKYSATDLDDINPLDDMALTLRMVEEVGQRTRLGAVDMAIIRIQIGRLLGASWKQFASSLGSGTYTLTEASLVKVYGRAQADAYMKPPYDYLNGKGLYDRNKNVMFLLPGRTISEVASSVVHESTHALQREHEPDLAPFAREFQAFTAQRSFLLRLPPEAQEKLPEGYKQLVRAASDDQLSHLVESRYPAMKPVAKLEQHANLEAVKTHVEKEFRR